MKKDLSTYVEKPKDNFGLFSGYLKITYFGVGRLGLNLVLLFRYCLYFAYFPFKKY